MPSLPTLNEATRQLLRDQLVRLKRRDDITVTRVVSASATSCLYLGIQTYPAIAFEVEFTYANTRNTRRTADVLWPMGVYHDPSKPDPNVPAALWDVLNDALAVAFPAPARITRG